ncbi:hypothetical protein DBV15_12485 [Temnothorax longispinosus]|uniref:Uncharacterized protein n=1 Tax=Temnothorax longispinosus TaxID=300112 RepID=A0A4S2L2Z9_9HYME|nr:hypothetical protein DBV15_12485 [Temnothorax longispinosus]
MLAEKATGVWEGNGEHLPRSDRRNLFKRFESADLTRLWRIYARSVDEKVKDWQGEHRANGGEKESRNGESDIRKLYETARLSKIDGILGFAPISHDLPTTRTVKKKNEIKEAADGCRKRSLGKGKWRDGVDTV